MLDIFYALLALTGQPPQTGADPLAPARAGKLQCHTPDKVKKTCSAIASYEAQPDGSFRNAAKVLIVPDQGISLETVTTVHVHDGAVCGTITKADLMAGKLVVSGEPLPADQAAPFLEQIAASFASAGVMDKVLCTTYRADGEVLKTELTIDGVAKPEFAQTVIWVDANDGYSLGK